ncbi:MAG: hypothetical protein V7784_19575, partial [Oceanospirillaceae bacterium]
SITLLASGSIFAGETYLGGSVPEICTVTGMGNALDFPDMNAGTAVTSNVHLQCNDGDGAILKLTSSEGGMESDDREDRSVHYNAVLNHNLPGGPSSLTLTADGIPGLGTNDIFVEQSVNGSGMFADGKPATLVVTLEQSARWAGGYSDTLSLDVTSR